MHEVAQRRINGLDSEDGKSEIPTVLDENAMKCTDGSTEDYAMTLEVPSTKLRIDHHFILSFYENVRKRISLFLPILNLFDSNRIEIIRLNFEQNIE